MVAILKLMIGALRDCIMSRGRLEAEVTVLRHQLNMLRRRLPRGVRPNAFDRAIFVYLYRHFPDIGNAVAILRPETVIRWHRMGFPAWWRWKSRNPGGRPKVDPELRDLVRRMCEENPLWGAPRIHGELLKLGFIVAQSTVSKYMLRGRRPPAQGWKTFLRNHADGIAAADFLVVPTLTFERLFALVILGVGRRDILWIGVTTNPTAQWLDHQITGALTRPRPFSSATMTAPMARCSRGGSGRWVFATALSRLDRHGRTDMSSAQSARSDVSVLTT